MLNWLRIRLKWPRSEYLVILMAVLAVFLSMLPTLVKALKTPPGTFYTFEHNTLHDYYYYLSLIEQGSEGRWRMTTYSTPERFAPQFAQTFYAALGHLARLVKIDTPQVYLFARITIGFILLLEIYLLALKSLVGKKTVLFACFLAYFGTAFWYVRNGQIMLPLSFWTEFDALERTTFIPHHIAAIALVIASILSLLPAIKIRRLNWQAGLFVVFGVLAGVVNPAALLCYIIALTVALPIYLWQGRLKLPNLLPVLAIYLGGLIFFGATLAFFSHLQQTVFPWTTYRDLFNQINYPITILNYGLGMSPILFLALFSVPWLKKVLKTSLAMPIIAGWAVAPFVGIYVLCRLFHIANSYFFQVWHIIPLSILGALGAEYIASLLPQKFRPYLWLPTIALILYFSIPWSTAMNYEINRYPNFPYNVYVPNDVMAAVKFLQEKTPPGSVVFTGKYLAPLVPAFTPNRSFYGHPVNTYKPQEKQSEADRFYRLNDVAFAKTILDQYEIKYVLFNFDAPGEDLNFLNKLGLSLVYKNNRVAIYGR